MGNFEVPLCQAAIAMAMPGAFLAHTWPAEPEWAVILGAIKYFCSA
jgi:hypothetical protein